MRKQSVLELRPDPNLLSHELGKSLQNPVAGKTGLAIPPSFSCWFSWMYLELVFDHPRS